MLFASFIVVVGARRAMVNENEDALTMGCAGLKNSCPKDHFICAQDRGCYKRGDERCPVLCDNGKEVLPEPYKSKFTYDKHASKGCFPSGNKGGKTLEPHDPEQPGWPTIDSCQKACDEVVWCQAFTRGIGEASSCWLRSSVDLERCKNDGKYETHVRQGARKKTPKCLSHTELSCKQVVQKHWDSDRHKGWAKGAFTPIFANASGVKFGEATIQDWHQIFWCGGPAAPKCELPPCSCSKPPCDYCGPNLVKETPKLTGPTEHIKLMAVKGHAMGYPLSSQWVGRPGTWCRALKPLPEFNLNAGCAGTPSVDIKVLSYNLFWWNLFGKKNGNNRQAGRLVESSGPWDFMGFQECDDAHRIVNDSMAYDTHSIYNGTRAVSIAWDKSKWRALATGYKDISEDGRSEWYGRRAIVWGRFQHRETKKVVFFVNFHGALPVGNKGGGMCGAEATAYNILRAVGEHMHSGDSIIFVGDFNAKSKSLLLNTLGKHMKLQFQGRSFGGVDNFFSNDCVHRVSTRNLGHGGSDHDALGGTFKI